MLYEVALTHISLSSPDKPITLFSLCPRMKIPVNVPMCEASVTSPALLVVEYGDDGEEPLTYLQELEVLYSCTLSIYTTPCNRKLSQPIIQQVSL